MSTTSEETETPTTEQVNELTPYYQQKIVDNVSKELVDKICNTLVTDSNNTLTDALIVQTQQSIANMFGKPENTDRFLDVILGGMKKSMQFIKGSSVLLYSILSDPNGYAQYKELITKVLEKAQTHSSEVDNYIDFFTNEAIRIVRRKPMDLFLKETLQSGGNNRSNTLKKRGRIWNKTQRRQHGGIKNPLKNFRNPLKNFRNPFGKTDEDKLKEQQQEKNRQMQLNKLNEAENYSKYRQYNLDNGIEEDENPSTTLLDDDHPMMSHFDDINKKITDIDNELKNVDESGERWKELTQKKDNLIDMRNTYENTISNNKQDEDTMADYQNNNEQNTEQISFVRDSISNINNYINTKKGNLETAKGDLETAKRDLETAKREKNKLTRKFNEDKETDPNNERIKEEYEENIREQNANIDKHNKEIETHNNEINKLNNHVNVLEDHVENRKKLNQFEQNYQDDIQNEKAKINTYSLKPKELLSNIHTGLKKGAQMLTGVRYKDAFDKAKEDDLKQERENTLNEFENKKKELQEIHGANTPEYKTHLALENAKKEQKINNIKKQRSLLDGNMKAHNKYDAIEKEHEAHVNVLQKHGELKQLMSAPLEDGETQEDRNAKITAKENELQDSLKQHAQANANADKLKITGKLRSTLKKTLGKYGPYASKTMKRGLSTALKGIGKTLTPTETPQKKLGPGKSDDELLTEYVSDLMQKLEDRIGNMDGLILNRINDAVYTHISKHPGPILNSLANIMNTPQVTQGLNGASAKILICSCLTNNSVLFGNALESAYKKKEEELNKQETTDGSASKTVFVSSDYTKSQPYIDDFTEYMMNNLKQQLFIEE